KGLQNPDSPVQIRVSPPERKHLRFVGAFLLYLEIFCLCSAGEYDMMKLKKSSICFRKVYRKRRVDWNS
ncbi:hypothetical protein, partial [Hominenteromicrobium sp.]|uniref:hypothetical protein n=1 Tax=Hominenteromicrobium sp. TaxID=3073581 RepID=UPI003996213D